MSDYAYVTLVTNEDYALGALALMRSIRLCKTDADLVAMHTGALSSEALSPLREIGVKTELVELLPTSEAFNITHSRSNIHGKAPFTKGNKPSFHTPLDNFSKLRLWQLPYKKIVFIDADALLLRNCDKLFEYPEFCAAPNVYQNIADFHRMNSGVFTACPSEKQFRSMLQALDQPDAFWQRTDQSFLQSYFPDWHGLPIFYNMLQYVWFAMPELWSWENIHILHYQYEKPWEKPHPKARKLEPLIRLWREIASGKPFPDQSSLPSPTA